MRQFASVLRNSNSEMESQIASLKEVTFLKLKEQDQLKFHQQCLTFILIALLAAMFWLAVKTHYA